MKKNIAGVYRGKAVWHYVEIVNGRLQSACTGDPIGVDKVQPISAIESAPAGERCSRFLCQQIRRYRKAKETGKVDDAKDI